ncbi:MAG: DUF4190 domain-containing protein [Phycisphaerae bacterium]
MTQPPYAPPPGGYGTPQGGFYEAKKTNGFAIASLVCGLLLCIPVITGLAGIVLGFLGLGKARDPQVDGGRGMAVAGILLSILGFLLWGGVAVGGWWAFGKVQEVARTELNNVIADVRAGNLQNIAVTGNTSLEAVQAEIAKLDGFGQVQDVGFENFAAETVNGQETIVARMNVTFEQGTATVNIMLAPDPNNPDALALDGITVTPTGGGSGGGSGGE